MRNEGAAGLATLLALADSRLPIGGHVHSGGVEEAVSSGLLRDKASVELYLRRRISTSGLVTASLAAAVCGGSLTPERGELEADARTPSPAARTASRAQGRGLLRLAKQLWPHHDWAAVGPRPHLSTVFGMVGAASGASTDQLAGCRRLHDAHRRRHRRATTARPRSRRHRREHPAPGAAVRPDRRRGRRRARRTVGSTAGRAR